MQQTRKPTRVPDLRASGRFSKAKKTLMLLTMVAPGAIWLLLLRYLPMGGIILAFKNYKIYPKDPAFLNNLIHSKWVGLDNFKFLFTTGDSWIMIRNTLAYNIVFIILGVIITCNWSADEYNKYARDGYWVKLDDMLASDAPELLATIPEGIWECARTNGLDGMGIYAVPGLKDTATQNCWDVNGTLLAELGYDVDAVCAAGLDYYSDEYEEMLQKAKDAKGGFLSAAHRARRPRASCDPHLHRDRRSQRRQRPVVLL